MRHRLHRAYSRGSKVPATGSSIDAPFAINELLPPEAAIDPSEDAVSIEAAIAMRATVAQDSPAVLTFFDAVVDLLTGTGRKQERRHRGTRCGERSSRLGYHPT